MLILLETLQRFAQRRRRGGSGIWTGVAAATILLRLYKRRAKPATLHETLEPGESILITHTTQHRG